MANFGPLTAEIGSVVWGTPANFNGFRDACVTAATSLTGGQPNFTQCLAVSWAGTLYTFLGLLPLIEFCPVQYSLYIQLWRSPRLAALLHGTPAVGDRQTLRRGTRNGIMELSRRVPPIFSWAVITLGIGPHSSFTFIALQ